MAKRKTIQDLKREKEKLKEKLAKERQKLKAIDKKIKSEYRKREARFLIAIGRTLLKYGILVKTNNGKCIAIPLKNSAFIKTFSEYSDIVIENKDFRKWLKCYENNHSGGADAPQEGKEEGRIADRINV